MMKRFSEISSRVINAWEAGFWHNSHKKDVESGHFYIFDDDPVTEFSPEKMPMVLKQCADIGKFVPNENGREWSFIVPGTRSGESDYEAKAYLMNEQYDEKLPTIIYHHPFGAYEDTDKHIRALLFGKYIKEKKANVVYMRAPSHTDSESFEPRFRTLHGMEYTLATSAALAAKMAETFREKSKQPMIAVGFSMGGMALSWAQLVFGKFDRTIPLVSSPDAARAFITGGLGEVVSRDKVRSEMPVYVAAFHPVERLWSAPG